MTTLAKISTFTVTPSNYMNGISNNYKITVSSSIESKSGDIILFTFPSEITGPIFSTSTMTSGTACPGITYVSTTICLNPSSNRM